MRWRGYLYINGSKTYDAIISSPNKFAIVDRFLTSITPSEIHQDISWVSGWIACGWFYQTWRLRFGKPKGE